jgi:archaellum biogenesis ATPase FlaH
VKSSKKDKEENVLIVELLSSVMMNDTENINETALKSLSQAEGTVLIVPRWSTYHNHARPWGYVNLGALGSN